jgi:hypothetical protein
MSNQLSTYPLRLPRSLRLGIEKMSEQDGVSINQFVAVAVAEKLSAMQAATFFEERRAKADLAAFDAVMNRKGGEAPREGDEVL